jgi:ribosomal protein L10
MAPPKVNQKQKKEKNFKRFYELLSKHKQIVIVTLDNVGSNQIQKIRKVI